MERESLLYRMDGELCMTKTIRKGIYTLIHSVLDTDFGRQNFFELTFIKDNGTKVSIPFYAPFKVETMGGIFDIPTYTDDEYEEMMMQAIESYGK